MYNNVIKLIMETKKIKTDADCSTAMTEEILKGIVESVVKDYIDNLVDATCCSIIEGTTDFETDCSGDIWAVSFPFDESVT